MTSDLNSRNVAKRLLILAVSSAYLAACMSLDGVRRLLGLPASYRTVVLTYHAVTHEDVARFRRQMKRLLRVAESVFADAPTRRLNRRTVAVTFDDGLRGVFDYAVPILTALGVRATMFVPTGFLGAPPGWIAPERRLPGSCGVLVSAESLGASDNRLVRVGSHTVTHPHLASLDADLAAAELDQSKGTLETILGRPITILSFPFGSFNQQILQLAAMAGYEAVFANIPLIEQDANGVRLIGRISVSPRDWPLEFTIKVLGGYEWLALGIPAKRAVFGLLRKNGYHR